ncbi:MAG: hypothetical protein HPY64_00165 [Anaerolineae bacterium]|nr:hypothetical protein [Anaerolineae bacterium]
MIVWSGWGSDGTPRCVQGESAAGSAKASTFAAESGDWSAPEESPQPLPDAESLELDRQPRMALAVVAQLDLAKMIAEALDRLHLQVLQEPQADRALQAVSTRCFDLVLVDVDLQPDGWKMVQAIRSRLSAPRWPLILLAAPDTVVDSQHRIPTEQSACLRKPVTVDELERTAAGMLGNRRSRRQPGRAGNRVEGCSEARNSHAWIEPEGAESMTNSLKTG